jgi:hypothetical protein
MTVIHREHPVQLVRYPAYERGAKMFVIRVFGENDVREVFQSRSERVAREQYDIERHYRCPRPGPPA